jgi:hypothetical protein
LYGTCSFSYNSGTVQSVWKSKSFKICSNWGFKKPRTIIADIHENVNAMPARKESASTHVLLIILLIITFPVWFALAAGLIGIAAGVFGAIMGVFGAIFGVFGALLGGLMALIALPFKILFGGWHDGWHLFPHHHFNAFAMIAVIIVVALIVKGRK